MDVNEFMAESNARARSGRRGARNLMVTAVMIVGTGAFLWIAAPYFSGGMGFAPSPWHLAVPAIGILGIVIGLAWMIRIYRVNPDPDSKAWRYRR